MKKLFPVYVCNEFERMTGIIGVRKIFKNFGDFEVKEEERLIKAIKQGYQVHIDSQITINKFKLN